jgi:ubiquinone/menaquinone biosynthesis C-methylase UbiE
MNFWQAETLAIAFMPIANATTRFSDRVENYDRYRPSYPPQVIHTLKTACGLKPEHVIADIASGTGIWTRQLVEAGKQVFAVEPNTEMREAAERSLAGSPNFRSVAGSAEETTLLDQSVDFVTVAQAAHWFDRPKARREFTRILKANGWLLLVWNERRTDSSPFLADYEQVLLTYSIDYREVRHDRMLSTIHEFFDPVPYEERIFPMRQELDFAGLEGRLLSSSYTPEPQHPNHAPMLAALRRCFDVHEKAGRVAIEYITRAYFGRVR